MPAITTAPSVLIRAARGSDGPALRPPRRARLGHGPRGRPARRRGRRRARRRPVGRHRRASSPTRSAPPPTSWRSWSCRPVGRAPPLAARAGGAHGPACRTGGVAHGVSAPAPTTRLRRRGRLGRLRRCACGNAAGWQVWGALWIVYIVWGSTYLAIRADGRDDAAAARRGRALHRSPAPILLPMLALAARLRSRSARPAASCSRAGFVGLMLPGRQRGRLASPSSTSRPASPRCWSPRSRCG